MPSPRAETTGIGLVALRRCVAQLRAKDAFPACSKPPQMARYLPFAVATERASEASPDTLTVISVLWSYDRIGQATLLLLVWVVEVGQTAVAIGGD